MTDEEKRKSRKSAERGRKNYSGGQRRGGGPRRRSPAGDGPRAPGSLTLSKIDGNRFALTAPRCAQARKIDLEDFEAFRGEGDFEAARDELLFLVEDCRGFLEAYNLLAELALEDEDIPLAQGHYGFSFENVTELIPRGFKGTLPVKEGYNRHFYEAGRGLARCLIARGEFAKGREVLDQLHTLDPKEPGTIALLKELDEQEA